MPVGAGAAEATARTCPGVLIRMGPTTLQEIIFRLASYWAERGCAILQPYDMQVGAGTFSPATFFSVLGPLPVKIGYVQPSRRPTDGRYGQNPNRLQHYYQFQLIIKPPPDEIQRMYLESLRAVGLDPREHDVRLVHDDWESPTLGASGIGWQVWADGQEISQFTYFQQMGGIELDPVSVEITYGMERIAAPVLGVEDVYSLKWAEGVSYSDLHREREVQFSKFNFDEADVEMLARLFEMFERECQRLVERGLEQPAYDFCIKCSHIFNLLDARSAISVAERVGYIARVRKLAKACATAYCDRMAAQWSTKAETPVH